MATFSKPFISAAALAGAAAVAVATPAIMPSVGVPTPTALSRAAVELTALSDVLSIPAVVWTDVLFGNQTWGGTLSSTTYGPAWAKPTDQFGQRAFVNPWAAYCGGRCDQAGIPGVSYMFFDALVNGNGNGYADYDNWPIGIVNYFFEPATAAFLGGGSSPQVQYVNNGFSAAAWYALAGSLGQAVPSLQVPLAAAFWGANDVTIGYDLALTIAAAVAQLVPVVGPITGNSILAYLGDLEVPGAPGTYYQYGLSGALNYWTDIADGSVPFPAAALAAPPAASVAAPVPAETATAPAVEAVTADAATPVKPDTAAIVASTPVADAPVETQAADTKADAPVAPVETQAADVADSTPAADVTVDAPEETPAADVTADAPEAPESTPAADTEPVETPDVKDAPAADEADSGPAGSSVKGGEESSAKADTSASAGAEASDAGAAKADSAKSDSAKSDSAGGDSAGSAE